MKYRVIAKTQSVEFEVFSIEANNDNGAIWSFRILLSSWLVVQKKNNIQVTFLKLLRVEKEGESFLDQEELSFEIANYIPRPMNKEEGAYI